MCRCVSVHRKVGIMNEMKRSINSSEEPRKLKFLKGKEHIYIYINRVAPLKLSQ